jgi:hypothetical protein
MSIRHIITTERDFDMEKTTDLTPTSTRRPDPAWIRGKCPTCGDDVVSNMYYYGGKGYRVVWECWASLAETPTCDYRRSV